MSEGERAGRWAVVYLSMVGAAAYFTIVMIVLVSLKNCFGVEE